MALNMKDLSDFILPLVQDGKEGEAKQLLANAAPATRSSRAKTSSKDTGGGLLGALGGLLGGDGKSGGGLASTLGGLLGDGASNSGGGLLDSLGGLLGGSNGGLLDSIGGLLGSGNGGGALSGLLAILPALLKLIKPDKIGMVADHVTTLVDKEKQSAAKPKPKPKPKRKAPASTGTLKTNVGTTSLRSTAKKPASAAKPGAAKTPAAPKKPAAGSAPKTTSAPVKRPTIHRPTNP